MWGLFYKVGQFIAKSGWYFKVNQLLQCGPCTMFKLLISMTLFLRYLQLCAREVIFCLMRHRNKIWSECKWSYTTYSFLCQIWERENQMEEVLEWWPHDIKCILLYNVLCTKPWNRTKSSNPLNLSFQPFESFVPIGCTSCLIPW